jgi:hypothetical protein
MYVTSSLRLRLLYLRANQLPVPTRPVERGDIDV